MKRGPLFWFGVAAGWSMMAAGAAGMIAQARYAKPFESAAWIVGAAIVHDGLVAPIVIAAARRLRRVVGPARLAVAQSLTIGTALVVAVSLPVVLTLGRRADNPSLLPRRYPAGLALTLVALWVGTWVVATRATRRGTRERER